MPQQGRSPSFKGSLDRKGIAASSHRGGKAVAEIEFTILNLTFGHRLTQSILSPSMADAIKRTLPFPTRNRKCALVIHISARHRREVGRASCRERVQLPVVGGR